MADIFGGHLPQGRAPSEALERENGRCHPGLAMKPQRTRALPLFEQICAVLDVPLPASMFGKAEKEILANASGDWRALPSPSALTSVSSATCADSFVTARRYRARRSTWPRAFCSTRACLALASSSKPMRCGWHGKYPALNLVAFCIRLRRIVCSTQQRRDDAASPKEGSKPMSGAIAVTAAKKLENQIRSSSARILRANPKRSSRAASGV